MLNTPITGEETWLYYYDVYYLQNHIPDSDSFETKTLIQ